jgi:hypothetical protein
MQKPWPTLTRLRLTSDNYSTPVIVPGFFLDVSAPKLRSFTSHNVGFLDLPKLNLSAPRLVTLSLLSILGPPTALDTFPVQEIHLARHASSCLLSLTSYLKAPASTWKTLSPGLIPPYSTASASRSSRYIPSPSFTFDNCAGSSVVQKISSHLSKLL